MIVFDFVALIDLGAYKHVKNQNLKKKKNPILYISLAESKIWNLFTDPIGELLYRKNLPYCRAEISKN